MEFSKQIIVAKPLEQVAALLEDPHHPLHWQPALVAIEPGAGERGTPGATARFSYDYKGTKFDLEETVLARVLPEHVVSSYATKGIEHKLTIRLEDAGDGTTRIDFDNELKFSGTMKLMGSMLGGKLREQAEKNVDYFKTWAETGEPAPKLGGTAG